MLRAVVVMLRPALLTLTMPSGLVWPRTMMVRRRRRLQLMPRKQLAPCMPPVP